MTFTWIYVHIKEEKQNKNKAWTITIDSAACLYSNRVSKLLVFFVPGFYFSKFNMQSHVPPFVKMLDYINKKMKRRASCVIIKQKIPHIYMDSLSWLDAR